MPYSVPKLRHLGSKRVRRLGDKLLLAGFAEVEINTVRASPSLPNHRPHSSLTVPPATSTVVGSRDDHRARWVVLRELVRAPYQKVEVVALLCKFVAVMSVRHLGRLARLAVRVRLFPGAV